MKFSQVTPEVTPEGEGELGIKLKQSYVRPLELYLSLQTIIKPADHCTRLYNSPAAL